MLISVPRSWWSLVYVLAASGESPACKSQQPAAQRRWIGCTCEYVTDFDQPGKVAIEVCSDDGLREGAAESCARGLGVGAVTTCACAPPSGVCGGAERCRLAGMGAGG